MSDKVSSAARGFFILACVIALANCSWFAPAPRQFTVYFQNDSATPTPEAQQVLNQVTQAAKDSHPHRIVVEGQADGATPRDSELALKRAKAVVDALVASGIDASKVNLKDTAALNSTPGVAGHKVLVWME